MSFEKEHFLPEEYATGASPEVERIPSSPPAAETRHEAPLNIKRLRQLLQKPERAVVLALALLSPSQISEPKQPEFKPATARLEQVQVRPETQEEDPVERKLRNLYGEDAAGLFWGYWRPVEGVTPIDPQTHQPLKSQPEVSEFSGRMEKYNIGLQTLDGKDFSETFDIDFNISRKEIAEGLALMPPSWIKYRVLSVGQSRTEIPVSDEYGLPKGTKALAVCENCNKPGTDAKISFAPNTSALEVFQTLPHELAHANDCWASFYMDPRERQSCALELAGRLTAPDRYQSSYVESIKNPAPSRAKFLKAREYMAEITEAYYKDPSQLNVKDARIVIRQLKKGSPRYNPEEQQKKYLEHSRKVRDRAVKPYQDRVYTKAFQHTFKNNLR